MGTFFNPGNGSFTQDKNSEIYIDKTELLKFLNKKLGTNGKCITVSHARRFGKSHAAGMIDAYYSLGSDSSKLFENTKIASDPDYEKYRNKYNVIHLDISSVWDYHKEDLIESIEERVCEDFQKIYGDLLNYKRDFYLLIQDIYSLTGIPFVIIIDEWDCVIRNSHDQALVHKYLQFLHSLFKSEESKSFLALGYITGILPIKKIKDESALNNFQEYTMLDSYPITEYYGFTEKEVKDLCKDYSMDFETVKAWYNGYLIDGEHMYNPNSVSQALERHKIDSYWRNTSAFDTINTFITMNYAGLKDDVMKMLTGGKVRINTNTFQNDFSIITSKDDALTALIHLGYLGYDQDAQTAFIPNEEIRQELTAATRRNPKNISVSLRNYNKNIADKTVLSSRKDENTMKYDFTTILDRKGKDSIAVEPFEADWIKWPGKTKEGFDIIPMWVADMNFPAVHTIPEAIIERTKHTTYGYFSPREEYFDAIIKWHKTRNGIEGLEPKHIGYENGVLGGVVSALNVLCSKGDSVLLHSPTYIGFTESLTNNGYHIVHSPLVKDENNVYRMDFEDMEKKIVENHIHAAIFCSPHNPTGRVWERWEIEKAMEIYKKHDVYVVSDEIWSDLLLNGHKHIPTQSVSEDAKQRTVALYAPSKTFNLAGLIGSYHIIYNDWLRERILKESSLSHYNSMNLLSMYALIGAYKLEGYEWA